MSGFNTVHRMEVVPWEHNGKKYELKLCRPNFASEGAFGRFLSERALQAIQRHRQIMGEKDYREALASWSTDCAVGKYEWGGSAVEEAIWNVKTLKELIFLIVTQSDDRPFDSREFFDLVWNSDTRDLLVESFFKVMAPTENPQNPSPSVPEVAAGQS